MNRDDVAARRYTKGGKLFWLVGHVASLVKLTGYTSQSISICKLLGFRSGAFDFLVLLGYSTTSMADWCPTCRDSFMVSSFQ